MTPAQLLLQSDQIRIALACLSRAGKLLKDANVSKRCLDRVEEAQTLAARHIRGELPR